MHYQPGQPDQYYHRYAYDAENRITDVYTTTNKALIGSDVLEEHEAYYAYYKHGPLARTILGQQQVQGIDYAYTLQGWLKGVNSMALDTARDMGKDGGLTARDAYGYQLNYFTGDYLPVNASRNPFPGHSAYIGAAYRPLYNGNISSMAVNIGKLNQPQLYNYEYDQLNRLVSMQAWRGFTTSTNSWSGMASTTDHQEAITYDANGNIKTYLRNGNTSAGKPLAMDNLTYYYSDSAGIRMSNKLRYVIDAVAAANYTEDIDTRPLKNFDYDTIGNLIKDSLEKISNISWNVYGKISQIKWYTTTTVGDLQMIRYAYDASGNRIRKTVYTNLNSTQYQAAHTWYVRDASGNVMATYTSAGVMPKTSTRDTTSKVTLYLSELHMYGSSRLGVWSRSVNMDVVPAGGGTVPLLGTAGIDTFNRGNKFFELANHLGNVLVTVSDRKIGQSPVNNLYTSFTADVVSATDYAPFGMQTPGRSFDAAGSTAYRYGFNGKENDNEVKGEGNQQDYGMRIYDPRMGRFLSVDPLTKSFAMLTPYQFASNSPAANIDLDGNEAKYFNIVITEVFDGKGRLVNSNSSINEDKSREAGWFVSGAIYRPEGELGFGSLISFTHVRIKPGPNGIEHTQIKDNGSLYLPSSDDRRGGRGGLYFVSSSGGYTHTNGSLSGDDAIPIKIDLLVGAVGGFPGGNSSKDMLPWEGSGNDIQKLAELPEIIRSDKNFMEKVAKVVEGFKSVMGAENAGEKYGENVDKFLIQTNLDVRDQISGNGKKFLECEKCGFYRQSGSSTQMNPYKKDTSGKGINKSNTQKIKYSDFHGEN